MHFKLSYIINALIIEFAFFLQLTGVGALGVLGIDARDLVEIQLAVGIAIVTSLFHYMVGIAVRPLTQATLNQRDAIRICVQVG